MCRYSFCAIRKCCLRLVLISACTLPCDSTFRFVSGISFSLGSLSPCECLSSSTRPLIMGCSALLSVVSQLLSVCVPADFPNKGYSGERPRLRRACKHPRNSAELLQQSSIVRKQCSSFRAVSPRWRRCAPSASCSFGNRSPCTSSIMQGLPKVRHVALG